MNPYTKLVYDEVMGHKASVGPYYKSDVHLGSGVKVTCYPFQSPLSETLARYITDLISADFKQYEAERNRKQ